MLTDNQMNFLMALLEGNADGPHVRGHRLTARTLIHRGLIEGHSKDGWFSHYTITDAGRSAMKGKCGSC